MKRLRALGGQRKYARGIESRQALGQIVVDAQLCKFVVIEPCADQLFVFENKTQRSDQMQLATGIGAKPDDVAGIGRYFGLVQDDVEHIVR